MTSPSSVEGEDDVQYVVVGRINKAHGIRGEVVVEALTDEPDAVFASGRRLFAGSADGKLARRDAELHVRGSTPFKGKWIVQLDELRDRTTAEQWRGRTLLLPDRELRPLEEGELYVHELIGMRVEREGGEPLGEVVDVFELPQGLGIDVRHGTGTVLLLYERSVVRTDRAARVLTVEVPEGLLE